jgi:hypothetical protein
MLERSEPKRMRYESVGQNRSVLSGERAPV